MEFKKLTVVLYSSVSLYFFFVSNLALHYVQVRIYVFTAYVAAMW